LTELDRRPGIPLLGLRAGRIAPLGPDGRASAIAKSPLAGRVAITRLGLAGDQQADRQHHGGVDKALHHYPAQHYAAWQAELPQQAALFEVGGFGENLATLGLDEGNVCLGDVFRLGTALIQVSQGRQPCAKLNIRFGLPDMVERVRASGRTGWYYRVLAEGEAGPEAVLHRIERPCPDWPLARLWQVLFGPERDRVALAALAGLTVLGASWRERAGRRLVSPPSQLSD
jgi:MOSC domain-containing protein YiiM